MFTKYNIFGIIYFFPETNSNRGKLCVENTLCGMLGNRYQSKHVALSRSARFACTYRDPSLWHTIVNNIAQLLRRCEREHTGCGHLGARNHVVGGFEVAVFARYKFVCKPVANCT